jgi:uncharacterized protein YdaU (DUF1376 family)
MNYFPFHVGDYAAHTAHLEPMEDLAYRRLLDQYYLREGPLPVDIQTTAKLIRMRSMAADVECVLREFFVLTDAGWMHARCDEEIQHMRHKQAMARASAEISVSIRKANAEKRRADAERALAESLAKAELPTPTPTPIKDKEEGQRAKRAPPLECPVGVEAQVWADWLALRKAKKAPVSATVLSEAISEASKAGMSLENFLRVWCGRGTQGMLAEWLKPHERAMNGHTAPAETAFQRSRRENVAAFTGGLAARRIAKPTEVIDGHVAALD